MWTNKGKRIVAAIIAIIMVLAMIIPIAMEMIV